MTAPLFALGLRRMVELESGLVELTLDCGCVARAQAWGWCWRVGRVLAPCGPCRDAARVAAEAERLAREALVDVRCRAGAHDWDLRLGGWRQCHRCRTVEVAA